MNSRIYKRIPIVCTLIVSILTVCLFSCTENIHISTENSPPRLVIYGYITTDTMRHAIKITRSTGYFVNTKPEGIRNATVTISSDEETFVLTESSSEAGLYLTEKDVAGKEGKTYTLSVSLDFDEDGEPEEYEATSLLPYSPTVDSINYRPSDLIKDHIEILMWGRISDAEENYLSLHLYRNNGLVNDSLSGFFVLDDEYLETKVMEEIPCFFLDQDEDEEKISSGDLLTLRVDAITKEYATFINNAQAELWGSDPLFSGPPANVETNIRSKTPSEQIRISGFFTAFSGDQASRMYE